MDGGLKTKYIVRKADTGEAVENYFVLRPGKDWAARYAVRAYADMTCNTALRDDLLKWVETFPVSSYDPEDARIDQSKLQLKPCPRCGKKGLIYYEGPKYYYAECEYCPIELHEIYFSAEEAAKAWNYRAEPPNNPLTLEELRQMDGEPVWIHSLDDGYGEWVLFQKIDLGETCAFAVIGATRNYYDGYGKSWNAYRRKLETPAYVEKGVHGNEI